MNLFLERIRKEVSKDYGKNSFGSIRIENMKISKTIITPDDQAPKWFETWNREVYQTQPPKWFENWNNETFIPFQNEVKKDIKNINDRLDNIVKLNNLKE